MFFTSGRFLDPEPPRNAGQFITAALPPRRKVNKHFVNGSYERSPIHQTLAVDENNGFSNREIYGDREQFYESDSIPNGASDRRYLGSPKRGNYNGQVLSTEPDEANSRQKIREHRFSSPEINYHPPVRSGPPPSRKFSEFSSVSPRLAYIIECNSQSGSSFSEPEEDDRLSNPSNSTNQWATTNSPQPASAAERTSSHVTSSNQWAQPRNAVHEQRCSRPRKLVRQSRLSHSADAYTSGHRPDNCAAASDYRKGRRYTAPLISINEWDNSTSSHPVIREEKSGLKPTRRLSLSPSVMERNSTSPRHSPKMSMDKNNKFYPTEYPADQLQSCNYLTTHRRNTGGMERLQKPHRGASPYDGGHSPQLNRCFDELSVGGEAVSQDLRPRLLTFPSVKKGGKKDLSPKRSNNKAEVSWSKMDTWNSQPKGPPTKRASIGVCSKKITFAEQEFLNSDISENFEKLRSFTVQKGQVFDCGYCYRDRNESVSSTPPGPISKKCDDDDAQDDIFDERNRANLSVEPERSSATSSSPRLGSSPRFFPVYKPNSSRRYTCPDIWLTRAETFMPSSLKECDVWVTGIYEVGKSTLITQLCRTAWDMETTSNASRDSKGDQNGLSVSFLVDGEEILVRFKEGSPAEVKLLRDENKPCAYLVLYTVDNRGSFKRLIDILSSILQDRPSKREKTPVVIVGNKEDLQRRRNVSQNEGKAVAKIYRCEFLEVSASMGLHIDELLKSLILQVQVALKSYHSGRDSGAGSESSEHEFSRRPSFIRTIQKNGRRLVKSCEELFSKMKK